MWIGQVEDDLVLRHNLRLFWLILIFFKITSWVIPQGCLDLWGKKVFHVIMVVKFLNTKVLVE